MDELDEGIKRISIHAPREGGDPGIRGWTACPPISIHAPREGGDYRYGHASL